MISLFWVFVILLVILWLYSLGHYICLLVFLKGTAVARDFAEYPEDSVAVLIPARNEGERSMHAIQSVLAQDHRGPLEIYLLLKDQTDSSVAFLKAAFPEASISGDAPAIIELANDRGRKVAVAFTGDESKSKKLNWMSARLSTAYLAILDSDHQAHPEWIRSSLCLMHEKQARIIQGRRGALSALGFFQLWDSLHQHIGCELFNVAFTRMKLTLFITGTTVVMETALLQNNPLTDCVTEDVEFSYRTLLQGVKIIYNPYYGSDEELSPDMYSFIARRRRWANGHTDAFFSNLGKLSSAPLSLWDRVQFLFHGAHYLIALFVFALHLVIGLFIMQGMSPVSQVAALLSSMILGAMIAKTQRSVGPGLRLAEIAVVFAWIFPAVLILLNLSQAFLANDLAQAALPIPPALQAIGLVALSAPLAVLIAGLAGFRQLNIGALIWVVLTYPLAFYLDVTGVLIGLVDFITNRKFWHVVARAPRPVAPENSAVTLHRVEARGIKDSMQFSTIVKASRAAFMRAFRVLLKPSRAATWILLLGLGYLGVRYTPAVMIPLAPADCEVLQHDTDPWIVPARKIDGYCVPAGKGKRPEWSRRTGSFLPVRQDNLKEVDPEFWDKLDSTFFCNQAVFTPANVIPMAEGGIRMRLSRESRNGKEFTTGSIATRDQPDARYLYGRFEAVMKPVKESGVVTALFLYRFDPWQEIDMEFVGNDTSRILLNVFYNPGNPGDLYNYGYRGTPVKVHLGFDAAEDYHRYAIEWDPEEIRWFVDDRLIHRRRAGYPTPIPHLPMRFYLNTWPTCSEELAGPFRPTTLPEDAEVKSVVISKYQPARLPWLSTFIDYLLPSPEVPENWRKESDWIQPLP